MSASVIQVGIPGGPEMLLLLVIAILLFGANRIPKLARSSGQAIGEFRKGREQIEQEVAELKGETTGDDAADDGDGVGSTDARTDTTSVERTSS